MPNPTALPEFSENPQLKLLTYKKYLKFAKFGLAHDLWTKNLWRHQTQKKSICY